MIKNIEMLTMYILLFSVSFVENFHSFEVENVVLIWICLLNDKNDHFYKIGEKRPIRSQKEKRKTDKSMI